MTPTEQVTARGQKKQKNLRHGKWTAEENAYAQELMNEFKAGQIHDLTEGISLRHYLAQKLHCLPKRISKKFEGTNYNGKQRYEKADFRRLPEEEQQRLAEIKALERRFITKNPDADPTGSLMRERFTQTAGFRNVSPVVAPVSANQSALTKAELLMGASNFGAFSASPTAADMVRLGAAGLTPPPPAAPSRALNVLPRPLGLLSGYPSLYLPGASGAGVMMGDAYGQQLVTGADVFLMCQRARLTDDAMQALLLASLKRSSSDESINRSSKRIRIA